MAAQNVGSLVEHIVSNTAPTAGVIFYLLIFVLMQKLILAVRPSIPRQPLQCLLLAQMVPHGPNLVGKLTTGQLICYAGFNLRPGVVVPGPLLKTGVQPVCIYLMDVAKKYMIPCENEPFVDVMPEFRR